MSRVEPMFPDESLWFECAACRRSNRVNIPNRDLCKASALLPVQCPACGVVTELKDGRARVGLEARLSFERPS